MYFVWMQNTGYSLGCQVNVGNYTTCIKCLGKVEVLLSANFEAVDLNGKKPWIMGNSKGAFLSQKHGQS